uniref:Tr-type G domain-containing protein n=1 Tax=Graphocephala atropunctata TaxID=36148 RepID=A0A1B6KGD5_9HEMI
MLSNGNFSLISCRHLKRCSRRLSTSNAVQATMKDGKEAVRKVGRIRNIGILAHIDAGKTTTTERMLFYSGRIRHMGEVHLGNTVTDYMEQERNRGITITSAAVTFSWNDHIFNLIDTPGHIDFTMEVEQTLNVMDGAIVVLDGSAGVEAQTLTVWRQADHYKIPRIVFTNKMDRHDASLTLSLESLQSKLGVPTLPLFLPLKEDRKLVGLLDLIALEKCVWRGERGEAVSRSRLTPADGGLWEESVAGRERLTDSLTDLDSSLADRVIALDSLQEVTSEELRAAVRRVTLSQSGVAVVCGSAYKNVGVQALMDTVVYYLPSPPDCTHAVTYSHFHHNLAAKVFKVTHDRHKGPLSFLRIYSGTLAKGQKVYNMRQQKSEPLTRIMVVEADDFDEVQEITEGNIAAVSGLQSTVTGDLLTSSLSAANAAKRSLSKAVNITEEEAEERFNVGAVVPDPVFFCSIEPPSQAYQQRLDEALAELQREDPSLRVSFDEEIGQTVLAGMGELHLEVIRERIRTEYKVAVDLGPMQIAYREMLQAPMTDTLVVNHTIGSYKHSVKVTLSLLPERRKDLLMLDRSKDNAENTTAITPRQLKSIRQGVTSGLAHGPILGSPVIGVTVMLHWLEVGRGTSDTILTSSVSQCIKKILAEAGTALMEPVMSLEVATDEQYLPTVLADLSRRRTQIRHIRVRGNNKMVEAMTPLAELLGYSKALRTITSGTASFSMEFDSFQEMGPLEQAEAIKRVTGF